MRNAQSTRIANRLVSRQDGFNEVKLPDLPSIPGMTTDSECRYYYWLTSKGYSGTGAVVEIGTWLGRSTIHLAAGIRDSGHPGLLCCYDDFLWKAPMERTAKKHNYNPKIAIGESFQPIFEENLRPVYNNIKITRADIYDMTWNDGPIEILVLDAPKELKDIIAIMKNFGPNLIPEVSQIVFQDFFMYTKYDTSILLSGMASYFSLNHVTSGGCIATFTVKKKLSINPNQYKKYDFREWDLQFANSNWNILYSKVKIPTHREILSIHLCLYLCDIGKKKDACKQIKLISFSDRNVFDKFRKDKRLYNKYGALYWAKGCQQQHRLSYPLWKIKEMAKKFRLLRWLARRVRMA